MGKVSSPFIGPGIVNRAVRKEWERRPVVDVTPTFYKNENFCPHRSAYKNCISNYSTYEKLLKINLV
jgi:hypothetical protein